MLVVVHRESTLEVRPQTGCSWRRYYSKLPFGERTSTNHLDLEMGLFRTSDVVSFAYRILTAYLDHRGYLHPKLTPAPWKVSFKHINDIGNKPQSRLFPVWLCIGSIIPIPRPWLLRSIGALEFLRDAPAALSTLAFALDFPSGTRNTCFIRTFILIKSLPFLLSCRYCSAHRAYVVEGKRIFD